MTEEWSQFINEPTTEWDLTKSGNRKRPSKRILKIGWSQYRQTQREARHDKKSGFKFKFKLN